MCSWFVRSVGQDRQKSPKKEKKERLLLGYLLTHAHTHTIERGGGSGLFWSGHHCGL